MRTLYTLLLLCFALFHFNQGKAQTEIISERTPKQPHPRILWFKGEEKQLDGLIRKDTVWRELHGTIINESKRLLGIPPVERIQIGRRLLDKSREAVRRMLFLGYAYRYTRDLAYLQRAEKELLKIAGFSDWNPTHFLDVAEMTMAAAIGYDWLHEDLSLSTRQVIKDAIINKGLLPSLESKYNSWLRAEHNWNQVCNAGMAFGAMAIFEENPQLASQIISRAVETVKVAMKDYGPDGVYPEGYGYWGYGTSFNVLLLSAIEKLYGTDFQLSEMPGFMKTTGFLENMTGLNGKTFNFSDAGSNAGFHPAMFWFAAKTKDLSILWEELKLMKRNGMKSLADDRLLPLTMIWNTGFSFGEITPPKKNMWVGHGKNPVALMRTSWTDPNGIYLAAKGGSASINHAHMDAGSFVMEADGVRWGMDFGSQNYESLESKGIRLFGRTQDAQRWTVFRLTNLVHNTLAIDSQHQKVEGSASFTSTGEKDNFMNAVMDLSSVYKDQLKTAQRGVALVDKNYVVIKDKVTTRDTTTKVRWTMLTPAQVTFTKDNEAELTSNGKKLLLRVNTTGKLVMKTWSTDPPNHYDAPNPGTLLVGFEVTFPANTTNQIEVMLIPQSKKFTVHSLPDLDSWNK